MGIATRVDPYPLLYGDLQGKILSTHKENLSMFPEYRRRKRYQRFFESSEVADQAIRYGVTVELRNGIYLEAVLGDKMETVFRGNRMCHLAWQNLEKVKNVVIWEQRTDGMILEAFVLY